MALTDYVTLGRSGLRVSPFCLGAMTFGEDWGWGSSVAESEAIIDRFIERGGNFIDTANVYTKGHSEKIIGDFIGRDRRQARPRRHRHQVLRQPVSRRSQRRRRRAQDDRRGVRAVAAPAADRLHRSLLDALLGSRSRRSKRRCARSTIWCASGKVRYIGFSDTPAWKVAQAQTIAQLPRLGAARRAADRVLAARAHRRRRADPDGARAGPRRHAVVAAEERRAVGQVHARERGDRQGRSRRARDAESRREGLRDHRRAHRASARSCRPSPASVALAWVQGRPGVASTIIGARRLDQLEQNLAALDAHADRRIRSRGSTSSRSRRSASRCSS